jgi:hypothetical protein
MSQSKQEEAFLYVLGSDKKIYDAALDYLQERVAIVGKNLTTAALKGLTDQNSRNAGLVLYGQTVELNNIIELIKSIRGYYE